MNAHAETTNAAGSGFVLRSFIAAGVLHPVERYGPKNDATIICTYDLNRFSASALIDVLRSHPVAVIGGIVHENPFYVPPEELLKELEHRKTPVSAS